MLSAVYQQLTESFYGRLFLVAAVALVVVPTVVLGSAFVIRTSKRLWTYRRGKDTLKHLPQHPLSGLGMYENPNEETELKWKKYINAETGQLYDLVAVGTGISGHQCVVVNDADLLQQMLTDPDPKAYPKAPLYEEVVADALLGDGLVTVTGLNQPKFERWQFHRRLLTPMFHFKALKDMIPMMVLYTKDLVEHLEKKGPNVWHRASDVLSRFTMSQIVWLAFGGTMDIDWLHERQLEIGHGWTKYAALHTFFGDLVQYVPFTPAWRIVQLRRETEGAIYNVIKQLRQEGNPENEAHGHAQNLIATMLKAKNPKTGKLVTDREIVEEACTMLFAGYDTTSTTMSWALYYVSKDPETLRWVQEELDSVLGFGASARDVTMEDLPNLKRTRAFINETLRLRPPLLTASRFTTHATKLGKYDIPAETIVNANIFLVHRNPKYWDDPHTFNPRRWDSNASDDADAASTEKHDEKRRHPFAFVPFAAGARNCIGKNFALQEMIIAMALVLSKFNVEYDPTKPFSVFGSPVPTPDVYLKFHPRK